MFVAMKPTRKIALPAYLPIPLYRLNQPLMF
jgi:hypothetical protein